MLLELALTTLSLYSVSCISNNIYEWATGIKDIKNKFDSSIQGLGIRNKQDETFNVIKVYPIKYGYRLIISIPPGLSLETLENKKKVLEDNLNGIIKLEKDQFKDYILLTIVNKDVDKFMFEPVKHKVNELYIGKDYKGSNYFINLDINPMILIAGATGNGKSMLLSNILTNIIYNNSNKSEIYLTQLIKGENSSFEECKNVKYSAYTKEELQFVINKIRSRIDERTNLLKAHGIRNINQWNKHYKNKYMKRIFLVCEEMSELMQLDIWEELWSVVKTGRSVGIHLIGVVQRTTADNLNPTVKSQMTMITFKQNNSISSINCINCNDALSLKVGECLVDGPGGLTKVKVPYIDDDFIILNKYVPEIKTPSKNIKLKKVYIDEPLDNMKVPKEEKTVQAVKKNIKRKGVISLEVINNANPKR